MSWEVGSIQCVHAQDGNLTKIVKLVLPNYCDVLFLYRCTCTSAQMQNTIRAFELSAYEVVEERNKAALYAQGTTQIMEEEHHA